MYEFGECVASQGIIKLIFAFYTYLKTVAVFKGNVIHNLLFNNSALNRFVDM